MHRAARPVLALLLLSNGTSGATGTGETAGTVRVAVHVDVSRRIESGSFAKDVLERERYFRSYHVPGMFSADRAAELETIGAVPGRGTHRFPLEPDPEGGFTPESRTRALGTLVETYRRAAQQHPGAIHALAYNHYDAWMRPEAAPRAGGAALEDWERKSGVDVLRKDLQEPFAAFTAEWLAGLRDEGVALPAWYSAKNEPVWDWDYRDFAAYTVGLARLARERVPEVAITGPCSAWPYPGSTFAKWAERERVFIDLAGGEVGGYDLHFYSKGHWSLPPDPVWQRQRVPTPSLHDAQRLGVRTVWDFGRLDAYLDLWNAHHVARWGGGPKPMIVSEFGSQTIHPQFGPWPNDFKPWLYMSTVTRMWMTFMDRPEIRLAVPFVLSESDVGHAPARGQAIYTRPGAPDSAELVPTRFRDFFAFFRDLAGRRLAWEVEAGRELAANRLFVQPFRDGDTVYVLVHNGGGYPDGAIDVDLALLAGGAIPGGLTLESKRIAFQGPVPDPEAGATIEGSLRIDATGGYEPLAGTVLSLGGEETRIVRARLAPDAIGAGRIRVERRFYGTGTLAPFVLGRVAETRFSLGAGSLGDATGARLVLSLARDGGFDRPAHVELNGRRFGPIDLGSSRGIAEFHGPVALDVPVDALAEGDNVLKVAFREPVRDGNPLLVSVRVDLVHDVEPGGRR